MKARLILYISALLIYGVYRSYQPAPKYDRIEIISDQVFKLNQMEYPTAEINDVVSDYRKTMNPDQRPRHRALRKNDLRYLIIPQKAFWHFWK